MLVLCALLTLSTAKSYYYYSKTDRVAAPSASETAGDSADVYVSHCTLRNLGTSGNDGGGIWANTNINFISVLDSYLSQCLGNWGGAIWCDAIRARIQRCCCNSSVASSHGHFIQFGGTSGVHRDRNATDCTVFNCGATSSGTGTIAGNKFGIFVTNTNFTSCLANDGSAVAVEDGCYVEASLLYVGGCSGKSGIFSKADSKLPSSVVSHSVFVSNKNSIALIDVQAPIYLSACRFAYNDGPLFKEGQHISLCDSVLDVSMSSLTTQSNNNWETFVPIATAITGTVPACVVTWTIQHTAHPATTPLPTASLPFSAIDGCWLQQLLGSRLVLNYYMFPASGCVIVVHCSFIDLALSYPVDGGALSIARYVSNLFSSATIRDCTFTNLVCMSYGGAIWSATEATEITRCCAVACRALSDGNFAWIDGAQMPLHFRSITACSMFNCSSSAGSPSGKGAVACNVAPLCVSLANFTACQSACFAISLVSPGCLDAGFVWVSGGAGRAGIEISESSEVENRITASYFVGNILGGDSPGAVALRGAVRLSLSGCYFFANTGNQDLTFVPNVAVLFITGSSFACTSLPGAPTGGDNTWGFSSVDVETINSAIAPICVTEELTQTVLAPVLTASPSISMTPTASAACTYMIQNVTSVRVSRDERDCFVVAFCTFAEITSWDVDGGALSVGASHVIAWIRDSDFRQIVATNTTLNDVNGGAIWTGCRTLEILRCCGYDCNSTDNGGFTYFGGDPGELYSRNATESTIFRCACFSGHEGSWKGGSIASAVANVTVTLTNFTACEARFGAAISHTAGGPLVVRSVTVLECNATTCIDLSHPLVPQYAIPYSVEISSSWFIANSLSTGGSVICARGATYALNGPYTVVITECHFANNPADLAAKLIDNDFYWSAVPSFSVSKSKFSNAQPSLSMGPATDNEWGALFNLTPVALDAPPNCVAWRLTTAGFSASSPWEATLFLRVTAQAVSQSFSHSDALLFSSLLIPGSMPAPPSVLFSASIWRADSLLAPFPATDGFPTSSSLAPSALIGSDSFGSLLLDESAILILSGGVRQTLVFPASADFVLSATEAVSTAIAATALTGSTALAASIAGPLSADLSDSAPLSSTNPGFCISASFSFSFVMDGTAPLEPSVRFCQTIGNGSAPVLPNTPAPGLTRALELSGELPVSADLGASPELGDSTELPVSTDLCVSSELRASSELGDSAELPVSADLRVSRAFSDSGELCASSELHGSAAPDPSDGFGAGTNLGLGQSGPIQATALASTASVTASIAPVPSRLIASAFGPATPLPVPSTAFGPSSFPPASPVFADSAAFSPSTAFTAVTLFIRSHVSDTRAFPPSSAVPSTQTLVLAPSEAAAGSGTRASVGVAWIAAVAAILALIAIVGIVWGVIAWRRRKRTSTSKDEGIETESQAFTDDDGRNELDFENPLASDGPGQSDFEIVSDDGDQADESVILL
jgi:hypothetical protein